ncbi:MAG: STAS domain-containing protein [Candidatus Wallbacteria bacterium]|mgnify:CR=1 FL=1
MNVNVTKLENQWTMLEISGRIDANTSPQLEIEFNKVIATNPSKLAANLTAVEYISSAGLRVLLAALKQMNKNSGKMSLINPSANVKEVLDLSGFSKLFTINASAGELA